jgi:hypothetical protein
MMDKVLEQILGELDDIEGDGAMKHSAEECPDPLGCTMHDGESSEALAKPGEESPAAVKIEVHKLGMPTLDGGDESDKAEEGLSPEEAEELRKLLK